MTTKYEGKVENDEEVGESDEVMSSPSNSKEHSNTTRNQLCHCEVCNY